MIEPAEPTEPAEPRVGGLYSHAVDDSARTYSVLKVLAVDEGAVHIRAYSNRFDSRPASIRPEDLFILRLMRQPDGSWGPPDGPLGVGHLPLSRRQFDAWQPELIGIQPVGADELDGYNAWREAGGGVWG
jgi:hypothetical protein